MYIQPQLIEPRLPYANEAKEIVALKIEAASNAEISDHFRNSWAIKRGSDGNYTIARDFSESEGIELDIEVKNAVCKLFHSNLVNRGSKSEVIIKLPTIEVPTGKELIGARGNVCCLGGACLACPNFRA